jgi:hypothetical protein
MLSHQTHDAGQNLGTKFWRLRGSCGVGLIERAAVMPDQADNLIAELSDPMT